MNIDFPDSLVNGDTVFYAFIYGLVGSLLLGNSWLTPRPRVAVLVAILVIPAWILALGSGLELFAQGYESPITQSDVSNFDGHMPRRGGLVLLAIQILPFFMVGYSGFMLFVLTKYIIACFTRTRRG